MEKQKIIQIHSDYKFVSSSTLFEGNYFENQIIIIKNQRPYEGPDKENTLIFTRGVRDIRRILSICKTADLVVLHDLDTIKSLVALELPKKIKIAWRFFGHELYKRKADLFLSQKSQKFEYNNKFTLKRRLLNILIKMYLHLKFGYGSNPDLLFYKAIERIDYMLVLSKEEYDLLSQYWNNLPEFVKLPIPNRDTIDRNITLPDFSLKNENEKPTIVLGNNKSLYNNHLDLIELIDNTPGKSDYNFILLFNYGPDGSYAKAVRDAVNGKKHFTLIEEFIPPEEFEHFYQKINALVINGYREMGVHNIFMALKYGVKVYLNEKNVLLKWFRNEGLQIFTIDDLKNDLKNNNIQLDYATAQENLNQFWKLLEKYTIIDFQRNLYKKVIVGQENY